MTRHVFVRVGTAGWSNPPSAKPSRRSEQSHLEYYAENFSCVEINSSFYKSHRPATYLAWRLATPPNFQFSVKMPREITHEAALVGGARAVKRFFADIEPLSSKLGAVLIQLPPSLEFSPRRAAAFFRLLPENRSAVFACEPRHASWLSMAADELMSRYRVTRVAADPSRVPGADTIGGFREHAYYRWHGSPRMYYSSYPDETLRRLAAQVRREMRPNTWCIFDNTARHAAWDNAQALARLLKRSGPVVRAT